MDLYLFSAFDFLNNPKQLGEVSTVWQIVSIDSDLYFVI